MELLEIPVILMLYNIVRAVQNVTETNLGERGRDIMDVVSWRLPHEMKQNIKPQSE
jgi:hypothetical protein